MSRLAPKRLITIIHFQGYPIGEPIPAGTHCSGEISHREIN